jgi:hypothetical protein
MKGRTRCYRHGGKTPVGLESPHTVTGMRSKYLRRVHPGRGAFLPEGLFELYETARTDPELLKIRNDVALAEAMLAHYTSQLHDHRAVTARQQHRILSLMEHRRKLIETEAKRLKDLHQMISLDKYINQMTVVGNIIRKHLTDLPEVLDALHADLQRHLLASAPNDQGDDDA